MPSPESSRGIGARVTCTHLLAILDDAPQPCYSYNKKPGTDSAGHFLRHWHNRPLRCRLLRQGRVGGPTGGLGLCEDMPSFQYAQSQD